MEHLYEEAIQFVRTRNPRNAGRLQEALVPLQKILDVGQRTWPLESAEAFSPQQCEEMRHLIAEASLRKVERIEVLTRRVMPPKLWIGHNPWRLAWERLQDDCEMGEDVATSINELDTHEDELETILHKTLGITEGSVWKDAASGTKCEYLLISLFAAAYFDKREIFEQFARVVALLPQAYPFAILKGTGYFIAK